MSCCNCEHYDVLAKRIEAATARLAQVEDEVSAIESELQALRNLQEKIVHAQCRTAQFQAAEGGDDE